MSDVLTAAEAADLLRVTGGDANPFLDPPDRKPARDRGVLSITQHRIK